MNSTPKTDQTFGKFGLYWFCGLAGLAALNFVFDRSINTTTLFPFHEDILSASFPTAGLAGLASGGVAIWQSPQLAIWRRTGLAIAFAAMGALAIFGLYIGMMDMLLGVIDFPPDKTRTYTGLVRISRAYQSKGRNPNWNIQTMPIWSNMNITKEDYDFMLAHRRPGGSANDPDEISSKGYFCARVTLQEAGDGEALRVMNAGRRKLPQGTVIVCPPSNGTSANN